MPLSRWTPPPTVSPQEGYILTGGEKQRWLAAFLRAYRHELFDAAFQDELAERYRDTGAGKVPLCPARMAMALILQGDLGGADAEAVELSVGDLRGQMVLDRLRLALDSSPLEGAGRVEDTSNLMGHAARQVVERVAPVGEREGEPGGRQAGIPLLLASSIKKALDCDWSDKHHQAAAVERLAHEVGS